MFANDDDDELFSAPMNDLFLSQSPSQNLDIPTEIDINFEVKPKLFCCSGPVSHNDTRFNPNSLLMLREVIYLDRLQNSSSLISDDINADLYDRNYTSGSVILNDLERLLPLASQSFRQLIFITKSQGYKIASACAENNNYFRMRQDVSEFVYYLRHFIIRYYHSPGLFCYLERIVTEINGKLRRLCTQNVDHLLLHFMYNGVCRNGNKSTLAAYHTFHCYLELRWYYLTIEHFIKLYKQSLNAGLTNSEELNANPLDIANVFEADIADLMYDLMRISVRVFHEVLKNNFEKSTPFHCVCLKELWLLIQFHVESLQLHGLCKSFWEIYNQVFERIQSNVHEPQTSHTDLELLFTKPTDNAQKNLFILWHTYHVAVLQGYNKNGDFVGPSSKRISSNYELIMKNLSEWFQLNQTTNIEAILRIIIPQLTNLAINSWSLSPDLITVLWEYFHRRLDSCFYLPGAPPRTMAITCKTPKMFLNQIKSRLENNWEANPSEESSYSLFLRLLGLYLRRCVNTKNLSQLGRWKGRIYSKITVSKLTALREIGFYNFISLFLTMGITIGVEEVSTELMGFLERIPSNKIKNTKRTSFLICTYLSLMKLYVENHIPIQILATNLKTQLQDFTYDSETVMEGLKDVIESSQKFDLGEHVFFADSWLHSYITPDANKHALDFLQIVINKLRTIYAAASPKLENDPMLHKKITINLYKNILPHLLLQIPSQKINLLATDLYASFTILCLDDAEAVRAGGYTFSELFKKFTAQTFFKTHNLERYLCRILEYDQCIAALKDSSSNYEGNLLELWLYCNLTCTEENCSQLTNLTDLLVKLPVVDSIVSTLGINSLNLIHFLPALEYRYRTEKKYAVTSELEKFLNKCLTGIPDRITKILSSSDTCQELITKVYVTMGKIFFHCAKMFYVPMDSKCLLCVFVERMLLPPALFQGRTLHEYCVWAIRQSWHLFFLGISNTIKKITGVEMKDNIPENMLSHLIIQYVPYFYFDHATIEHPFLHIFANENNNELGSMLLKKLSSSILCLKGKDITLNCTKVMSFLKILFRKINRTEWAVFIFLEGVLTGLFAQIMFSEKYPAQHENRIKFLDEVLKWRLYENNPESNRIIKKTFRELCNMYLLRYGTIFMRLLKHVVETYPELAAQVTSIVALQMYRLHDQQHGSDFDEVRAKFQEISNSIKNQRQ